MPSEARTGARTGARTVARKAFLLRVSPELHEALERWAADELRSVNGQIEYLLTDAVRRRRRGRDRPRRAETGKGAGAPRRAL